MEHDDTIRLLKECDAGTKMAVSSINEVLESVKNERLYLPVYLAEGAEGESDYNDNADIDEQKLGFPFQRDFSHF